MGRKIISAAILAVLVSTGIPLGVQGSVDTAGSIDKELHEEEMLIEATGILENYEWASEYKEDSPWEVFGENEDLYPPIDGEDGRTIRTAPLDLRDKDSTDRLDGEGWKWERMENGGILTLSNCHFRSEDIYTIIAEGDVSIVLYGKNTLEVSNKDDWFRPVIAGGKDLNLTIAAGDDEGSLEFVSDGMEDSAFCRYGIGADRLVIESGNIYSNVQFCDVNFLEMSGGCLNILTEENDETAIVSERGELIFSGGDVIINSNHVGIIGNVTVTGSNMEIYADWGILCNNLTLDSAQRFIVESTSRSIVIGTSSPGKLSILNLGDEFYVEMSECEYFCHPIYPIGSSSESEIIIAEADYTFVNEAVQAANSLREQDYKDFTAVKMALQKVKWNQNILSECENADGYTVVRKRDVDAYGRNIYEAINNLEPIPEVEKANINKVQTWGYSSVKLTWDRVENADGYRLYYAEAPGTPWKYIAQIKDGDTISYVHTGRTTGKTYTYYMRAYRMEDGRQYFGAYSAGKSGKALPRQVKITEASAGKNQAAICWERVNGANGYRIYYKNSENGKWHYVTQIGKGTTTSYVHKGVKAGEDYYYTMRAYRTVNGEKVFGAYASWKKMK